MANFDYYGVVEEFFNKNNMHYRVGYEDDEQRNYVLTISGMDNVPCLQVIVEVVVLGMVKIRTYLAYNLKEELVPEMLREANSINEKYKFIKVSIDDDNDVEACHDFFLVDDENALEQFSHNFSAILTGMNESYPGIARVVLGF